MALHISGKLCVIGVVVAIVITAFSLPPGDELDLRMRPQVMILDEPRERGPELGPVVHGPVANPGFLLRATAYNSEVNQTDSTPHITATGTRTRFGIVAVSRDLLGDDIPYGSLVRIRDLGNYHNGRGAGLFQGVLDEQQVFIVEDTMHARKRNQIDVWFPDIETAIKWGVRQVEVEVIRYGHDGPELHSVLSDFTAVPQLLASR